MANGSQLSGLGTRFLTGPDLAVDSADQPVGLWVGVSSTGQAGYRSLN